MNTHRLIYCSLWARYFVYFDVWLVYVLKRTGPVSLGCIVDIFLCQPFVDLVHGGFAGCSYHRFISFYTISFYSEQSE